MRSRAGYLVYNKYNITSKKNSVVSMFTFEVPSTFIAQTDIQSQYTLGCEKHSNKPRMQRS